MTASSYPPQSCYLAPSTVTIPAMNCHTLTETGLDDCALPSTVRYKRVLAWPMPWPLPWPFHQSPSASWNVSAAVMMPSRILPSSLRPSSAAACRRARRPTPCWARGERIPTGLGYEASLPASAGVCLSWPAGPHIPCVFHLARSTSHLQSPHKSSASSAIPPGSSMGRSVVRVTVAHGPPQPVLAARMTRLIRAALVHLPTQFQVNFFTCQPGRII